MKAFRKAALAAVKLTNVGPTEDGGGWWGKGVDDCIAALEAAAAAAKWWKPWSWLSYAFAAAVALLKFIKAQKLHDKKILEDAGA